MAEIRKELEDLKEINENLKKDLEERKLELERLRAEAQKPEELNKDIYKKLENKNSKLIAENKNLLEDCNVLQSELIEAGKIIAIGTVASGIAREFNNMLVGPGILAQEYLEKNITDNLTLLFKEILSYCTSGENLLKLLLGNEEYYDKLIENLEINEIIEDIIILMNSVFERDNIEIIKNYGNLPKIKLREIKIREALVNILLNARESIKSAYESGEITITTTSDSEYIKIAISDTGEGVAKESLKRIFEPDTIVRSAQRKRFLPRMGYGLRKTYRLIKDNNGTMEVESQPGKGSSFIIWLKHKEG